MKILVTGGIGNIGLTVSIYLLSRGYDLRIIDHIAPKEIEPDIKADIQKAEYCQVDIRDFQAVKNICEGIDVIIHLAAIPHPIQGQAPEIFHVNAGGTFNVFQAAADLGIKRVVCASSINYLGNGYGKRWIDVKYFPIDEDHPGQATDVYAFSKQLLEQIAAYFWQRDEITSACLRFPFVYNPRQFSPDRKDQYLQSNRDSYAQLMDLLNDPREIFIYGTRLLHQAEYRYGLQSLLSTIWRKLINAASIHSSLGGTQLKCAKGFIKTNALVEAVSGLVLATQPVF